MKTSGIYVIINTINNKKYIGSSKNIEQRKRSHFHRLRHNKHENDYLQKQHSNALLLCHISAITATKKNDRINYPVIS